MPKKSLEGGSLRSARALKAPLLMGWLAYLLGFVILIPAYYFEQNARLWDKLATGGAYTVIFATLGYLLLTVSLLLFAKRPLIEFEEDLVRFPLLGLTISRNDVADVALQGTEVLAQYRLAITLKVPLRRQFWTWLLMPTAYAFKDKVYLVPMFIDAPAGSIAAKVFTAVAPERATP